MLVIACADTPEPPPEPVATPAVVRLMGVLDQDRDGVLSKLEFREVAHPDLAFARVDTSGDGRVDARELEVLVRTRSPVLSNHKDPGVSP